MPTWDLLKEDRLGRTEMSRMDLQPGDEETIWAAVSTVTGERTDQKCRMQPDRPESFACGFRRQR